MTPHRRDNAQDAPPDGRLLPTWLSAVVLALVAGLLVANAAVAWHNVREVEAATRQVAHTQEVRFALEAVLSAVQDAEAEQRGFLITRREDYLEPYRSATAEVGQRLVQVARLTADDLELQKSLSEVRRLVDAKLESLREAVLLQQRDPEHGFEAARRLALSGRGERLMADLRRTVVGVQNRERALLASQEQEAVASLRMAEANTLTSLGAGVALAALIFALSRRHLVARRRSELALRESEERFRLLVEGVAGYAIFMLAPDGTVTSWNLGAERLKGYRAEEILGQPFTRFYPEEEAQAGTPRRLLAAAASQGRVEAEGWRVRKDGSRFWASVLITAFRDAAGNLRGFAKLTRDVSERREAETALRRNEARFRAFFETPAVGTAEISLGGRFLAVNERLCRMTGRAREELVGSDLAKLWVEATEQERRELHDYLEGKADLYRAIKQYRRQDGTVIWVQVDAALVRDAEGRPLRSSGIIQDITKRKRTDDALRAALADAEEKSRLLKALMDQIPEGITIADAPDVRIRMVSRYGLELTGKPREMLEGIPVEEHAQRWDIYAADGATPANNDDLPLTRATRTGELVHDEEWVLGTPAGARVPILCNAGPIRDASGAIVGGVMAWRDISERKETERLRRAEVALEQANERLREADQRKDEFLAVLSHELRNPLAPIRNSVYILQRAAPGGQQAERAQQVIDRQVGHLTRLVDDLLDVTRISRGKFRLQRERLELRELVRRTAEDHRDLFVRSGIALDVELADEPLYCDGDATRLSQAVGNLLGNAVKFTPRGGRVTLRLRREGPVAAVHVEDTGAGISPALLPTLFEPFMQADQTLDRSLGGLGLGLALVKGVVEMHGGSVSATSGGSDMGAQFAIRLPLAEPNESGPSAASPVETRRRGWRVLVIEDNWDCAASLKEALELDGHDVELAGSGQEGLDRTHSFRPDIVLCDIGLPGIDGYEVARRLRADPELRSVLLVALSGYALPEDVERSKAAGFDKHVAKPVDVEALERELAET